jgi:hypothetical protein
MSIVTRSEYGIPVARSLNDFIADLESVTGSALIGYRPAPQTKLERAQAIAAEVRARKFPPVKRIQLENEE